MHLSWLHNDTYPARMCDVFTIYLKLKVVFFYLQHPDLDLTRLQH